MSRTYRRTEDHLYDVHGQFFTWEEMLKWEQDNDFYVSKYYACMGWNSITKIHKKGRDTKPWGNPPHWFKQKARRRERAKVKTAMDHERYDTIPIFKQSDQWNWT